MLIQPLYAYATKITREGGNTPSFHNRKPYRSKVLKRMARDTARVGDDGAWRSTAPVLYHPAPRNNNPA